MDSTIYRDGLFNVSEDENMALNLGVFGFIPIDM
jgi:hypothetical protein